MKSLTTLLSKLLVVLAIVGPLSTAHAAEVQQRALDGATHLPSSHKSGNLEVNGVSYHYRIYGKGEPLLLLHGGLGQIEMFGPALAALAEHRQVIGVDLHGHGRTALGNRPIRYVDMGDDMAAVLQRLGYPQVDVMGYSMGGAVALRMAVQHPERVRRLVVASAPFARDGWYPEILPQQAAVGSAMAEQMKGTPMYKSYAAVAPRPQDFPRLLDGLGELMREPYDWAADIRKLAMPVMLIYGDSDMVRPEHIVRFYQLLGGGLKDAGWGRQDMAKNRLAIIPNFTHYDLFLSPQLASTALTFLVSTTDVTPGHRPASARK